MDLVMISMKILFYFIILFVFVFILGNLYLDIQHRMNEKNNVKEIKKTKRKSEENKKKWWGYLKSSNWWSKYKKKNIIQNKKIEGFVNVQKQTFINTTTNEKNANKFKKIILPNVENYDLEIAIPEGQKIYSTVQGNWGFNADEHGVGFSTGVYRDGHSADGCILKGRSEKRYKFMLERGPIVIKYEIRKNNNEYQDIKIFVNNKEKLFIENEGVSSGELKYIGTNETYLNKEVDTNAEGRRPLDYLKFIPISNEI